MGMRKRHLIGFTDHSQQVIEMEFWFIWRKHLEKYRK